MKKKGRKDDKGDTEGGGNEKGIRSQVTRKASTKFEAEKDCCCVCVCWSVNDLVSPPSRGQPTARSPPNAHHYILFRAQWRSVKERGRQKELRNEMEKKEERER